MGKVDLVGSLPTGLGDLAGRSGAVYAGGIDGIGVPVPHPVLEGAPESAYLRKTSAVLGKQRRRAVTGRQSMPRAKCLRPFCTESVPYSTVCRLTHVSQGPETRPPVRKALFRALLSPLHPGRSGTCMAGPGDTRREPEYPLGPTTGKGVEPCAEAGK